MKKQKKLFSLLLALLCILSLLAGCAGSTEKSEETESENNVISETEKETGRLAPENYDGEEFADAQDILPYPGGKAQDHSDLGDGYEQVLISDTDRAMYKAYASRLKENGYSLYGEEIISGNSFSTYTKDGSMIYFYYCESSGETRIIKADNVLLPALEAPEYEKVCEAEYITLKIHDSDGKVDDNALASLIRLEDGSFIIIDGGRNNEHQAKHIYETLCKFALDPDSILIRAWILSHYHKDHVGAFYKFSDLYGDAENIKVESFIMNFCFTPEQTATLSNVTNFTKVPQTISTVYPDALVYKCLTGQVYHFAGLDMEVLVTMSDFIPLVIGYEAEDAKLDDGDGNNQSIVVRFRSPSGNRLMITGDATNILLDDMADRYGSEYLRTEIVTSPHHAYNSDVYKKRNATDKFYDAVQPKILIVTSTHNYNFNKDNNPVNVRMVKLYHPARFNLDKVRSISFADLKVKKY